MLLATAAAVAASQPALSLLQEANVAVTALAAVAATGRSMQIVELAKSRPTSLTLAQHASDVAQVHGVSAHSLFIRLSVCTCGPDDEA